MKKYSEEKNTSYSDEKTALPTLEHTAFGTFRDPKDGMHYLVRIKYDGPSAIVGSISIQPISKSKDDAVSTFKIALGTESDIVG